MDTIEAISGPGAKNSNYEKIHYVYRPKDDEVAASEKPTAKSTSKEDPTEA